MKDKNAFSSYVQMKFSLSEVVMVSLHPNKIYANNYTLLFHFFLKYVKFVLIIGKMKSNCLIEFMKSQKTLIKLLVKWKWMGEILLFGSRKNLR